MNEEERTTKQLQEELAEARSDTLAILERPTATTAAPSAAGSAVGQLTEDAPLTGRQARVLRQRMEYLEGQNKRLRATWVAGTCQPASAIRSGKILKHCGSLWV